MIKILHIINSFDIGGNERFIIQLLENLDRAEFQQQVCVPDRGQDRTRDLEEICTKLKVPIDSIPVCGNFDFRIVGKLKKYIKRRQFDIVHTHLPYSQIWGRIAAKRAGVAAIISSEQGVYEFKGRFPYRQIERRLLRYTDRIITCSQRIKEHLTEKTGLDPGKITAIHNSVDTAAFQPITSESEQQELAEIRGQYGFDEDDFLFGTVGNLRPVKGQKYLIEAVPRIIEEVPHAKLLLVGGGPCREEYERYVIEMGLADKIKFAGIQQKIPRYLNMLDLFVLPSVMEGFGIAIVEAMACGTAVIATEVGGVPEIITNGENGIMIPAADPKALAEAVILASQNPEKLEQMASAALKITRDQFGVQKMTKKVADIYRTVLKNK